MKLRLMAAALLAGCLCAGCATTPSAGDREPVASPDPPKIAIHEGSSCAVHDQTRITCWGLSPLNPETSDTPQTIAVDQPIQGIFFGDDTLCALDRAGKIRCWGTGLDDTDKVSFERHAWVPSSLESTRARDLGIGDDHICALTTDAELKCVGEGSARALRTYRLGHAQASPPPGAFKAVSADGERTCAIARDGGIACWGKSLPGRDRRFRVSGDFVDLDVGERTGCGVTVAGKLRCWGVGTHPDWYESTHDFDQGVPPTSTPTVRYRQVSIGVDHTCAITTDGSPHCWGLGEHRDRNEGDNDFDQAVSTIDTASQISAADHHTCARSSDGIACWGTGRYPKDAVQDRDHGYGQSHVPSELRSESAPTPPGGSP